MISEINVGSVSAEYYSNTTIIAKINELIRAQNAMELGASSTTGSLKLPTHDEIWKIVADRNVKFRSKYSAIGEVLKIVNEFIDGNGR
jgi:hypothetical protein